KNFAETDNTPLIMFITFCVGAVQLTFGHIMQLKRNLSSPKFIAHIGWIVIIWAMLFVSEQIVLGGEVVQGAVTMSMAGYAVGAGSVLVLLFENYEKGKLFKGMAQTIGNLPMDVIGAFSDIVSYIRLFAVGLATVVIEQSFNAMAIGEGIESVTGFIIAAIVLLLGHSLNMILAVMSIVVHGIRLNMLEFSTHLGMTWSGKEYKPFKE
ncbi:MAG: ATPase, partial [Candidatus Marinimicrobia bacterium]|nr:ATPase [Candidatus Neomarinimicrobiota bacterium]